MPGLGGSSAYAYSGQMKQSVKLIAGNWKMNGLDDSLSQIEALCAALEAETPRCRVAVCPPATLLERAARASRSPVEIGGQDCHPEISGAFTGSVSAPMLKDAGAGLVIVGHSERRQGFGETDALVAAKAAAAARAGLEPIICVGETLGEREAGRAVEVVRSQTAGSVPDGLDAFSVAYEPVWAIGTGLTPTLADIEEVDAAIRAVLIERHGEKGRAAPILYGGSVKGSNAAEILNVPEVGGALVGGASLKAEDFLAIIRAL